MNKLQKALTTTAVSAALITGLGFAQGPQGQRGPGFAGQGRHGQHFGPKRGFGMQGGGPFARMGRHQNNGMAAGLLGRFSRLTQGSTVTASFYDADPATGAAASNSLNLVVGVDSEMTFMKSFKELAEASNYIVVNTGPQSRTIELNKEKNANSPRHGHGDSKITRMLSHLNLNSTVQASFYNANPADGGAALRTLSFVAGQDSELAFKNAFEEAAANASWVTINTSAQEHTINTAEIRAHRAEMQDQMHERRFGPGQARGKPGQ